MPLVLSHFLQNHASLPTSFSFEFVPNVHVSSCQSTHPATHDALGQGTPAEVRQQGGHI